MATPLARPAAAAPTRPRCRGRGWHYLEAGADQFPYEVDCGRCADQGDDDPDDDGGRWNDDIADAMISARTKVAHLAELMFAAGADDAGTFEAIAARINADGMTIDVHERGQPANDWTRYEGVRLTPAQVARAVALVRDPSYA